MGISDVGKLVLASLIPLSLGLLFVIIGTATNYWQLTESTGSKFYSGLWKYCSETSITSATCLNLDDAVTVEAWAKAVRAFVILALLTLAAAIAMVVVYVLKPDIKTMQIVALILAYVGGVCVFIGVGIYGGKYNTTGSSENKVSWSFALTTVGGVLGIVGGVLITINKVLN